MSSMRLAAARVAIKRSAPLCLIAALMMSAVASSPALAQRYFVEGVELGAAETVGGGVSVAAIQATWNANTQLRIECTTNKLRGAAIETLGDSKDELVLEGCKNGVSEIKNGTKTGLAAKCEVSNTPTVGMTGLLGTTNNRPIDLLFPAVGGLFGEVEIKEVAGGGGCAYGAAGGTKYKLTGRGAAWFGATGETENPEHELVFLPCQSEIKFETKNASIEATLVKIELSGAQVGKKWSVR
jgi:hypothetical protein